MIVTVTFNPSLDEWVRVPRFAPGALNRAVSFARYVGGKGINVSRVVRELGGRTIAVGFAGGADGHILTTGLDALGVPHWLVHVPGSTRNNFKILSDHPKSFTEVNCPGPRVTRDAAGRMHRALHRLVRPRRTRALVLSGSLPPGLPDGIYAALLRQFRRPGLLTVLDASGAALRAGLRESPWLIKPNRQEAEELVGARMRGRAAVAKAAKALTRRGPSLVMISLGPEGAALASAAHEDVLWATPPAVRVVSAVGAGDSTVAGFLMGWRRTRSLPGALRLAMACGTACVMTPGTELGHRRDIERLAPKVKIAAA